MRPGRHVGVDREFFLGRTFRAAAAILGIAFALEHDVHRRHDGDKQRHDRDLAFADILQEHDGDAGFAYILKK